MHGGLGLSYSDYKYWNGLSRFRKEVNRPNWGNLSSAVDVDRLGHLWSCHTRFSSAVSCVKPPPSFCNKSLIAHVNTRHFTESLESPSRFISRASLILIAFLHIHVILRLPVIYTFIAFSVPPSRCLLCIHAKLRKCWMCAILYRFQWGGGCCR